MRGGAMEAELQLPVSQALALFVKIVKKISKHLVDVQKSAISADIPEQPPARLDSTLGAGEGGRRNWDPVATSLADELKEAGDDATRALREKQRAMIDSLDLSKCVYFDLLFLLPRACGRLGVHAAHRASLN